MIHNSSIIYHLLQCFHFKTERIRNRVTKHLHKSSFDKLVQLGELLLINVNKTRNMIQSINYSVLFVQRRRNNRKVTYLFQVNALLCYATSLRLQKFSHTLKLVH